MLGYILLVIAIVLYFKPHLRVYSIFLYLSFLLKGFNLTTDEFIGVKNGDLAIIYTTVIIGSMILRKKFVSYNTPVTKWIYIFLFFLGCSWLFSYIHYGFSFYQILQASRSFFLIASYFIFIRLTPNEINKLIPLLLGITVITSILFCGQIIAGRPLMPYPGEGLIDEATGLIRLYNSPVFLDFFLVLSFVSEKYFKRNIYIYRVLFFITLMCTLGRTKIFMTVFAVILALYLKGGLGKTAKYLVILALFFLPFSGMIGDRFEKGGTSDDFETVLKGSYGADYSNDGGTMTYRLAWVYERWDYLMKRSFSEQLFGLGFISDSQRICHQMYNFRVGLPDEETGYIGQLATPDIAYGNLLSRLGILGGLIYLIFVFQLIKRLFIYRKSHILILVPCVLLSISIFGSMSGSGLSDPQTFAIYFIGCAFISNLKKNDYQNLVSSNKSI